MAVTFSTLDWSIQIFLYLDANVAEAPFLPKMVDLQSNKKTMHLDVMHLATPYPRDYKRLWDAWMGLLVTCLVAVIKMPKRTS